MIDFLESKRANYNVIGAICKNLDILRGDKYKVHSEDFSSKTLQIIFTAIYELSYNNPDLNEVSAIDIDNYLSNYPDYYKVFEKNNGFKYIVNSLESCNEKLFDKYYNELKKFSLLRLYQESGCDVRKIYNYEEENIAKRGEEYDKLMAMSEDEIIKEITLGMIEVQEQWAFKNTLVRTGYQAGEFLEENLSDIDKGGEIGISYSSEYYNSLFLGAPRGKFLLRSGDTGCGKSRWFVADACEFSCRQKYDFKKGWVNINQCTPTLFICTELELQELQILMLAYISGIPTRVLKMGDLDKKDLARVDYAKQIIEEAPLYVEEMADGDVNDLNMLISKYKLKYGIRNVLFDYIENTPKMSRAIGSLYGISNVREDQVLQNFTNFFKGLARKHDVFIESGTQLNREPVRNANALAGGKGTARKVDFGVIVAYPDDTEISKVQGHVEATGKMPNYAHFVYKNRGAGESNVILWMKTNLGNMREEFCFATDYRYNRIDIQGLTLIPVAEEMQVEKNDNPFEVSSEGIDF